MLSQNQNNRITLTDSAQPAGKLLRHYWMPAALSDELDNNRPVVAVNLLNEKLVLFKQADGKLGLIHRRCPHRGVDLLFGRLEAHGIRCPFHGWFFDASGQCIEQPGEPTGSRSCENIKINAYPVIEKNGIVWAYLGPGEPPAFPALDCFTAPHSHVFAFKGKWHCNWLQALEIGIDPAHASYLHRFLADEDPDNSYGKQFRGNAANTNMPMTQILREFPRPEIHIEETDFGMRLLSLRDLKNGDMHVRVTNQIFPCAICIPMSNEMTITQWHVPIDDTNCYWYSMFTSYGSPVDRDLMRAQRLAEHTLPDYEPIKNAANAYGYDPQEQADMTYTGMGLDINVHDQWACESMGAITDRREEHLATTDAGIITYRRQLRECLSIVEKGESAPLPMRNDDQATSAITGPAAIDAITDANTWRTDWQDAEQQRRSQASW